jgi:signal transduction histidine kinase
MDVIDNCLRTGTAIVRRELVLPEIGRGVYLGVTVSPLFDGEGQLHGAICLFTDLSGVRDLEEQLRLKDSLAAVGELTAGIAHEFRNGLATIHGYSKLFDLQALPEAYRPYVVGIRAETESLSQVVTNFLNFARPAQLTLSRVELDAICERAADEIRADVLALGGDVQVRGTFGAVEGDEVLLRQAFSNLLRNAFEACADASVVPHVVIESDVDAVQRIVRMAVHDNGPGIAPASRESVFRPFFTTKRNGTGLGLALVQKIVVFHNGRIVAAVSPGGGASLQITLPLAGDNT